MAGPASMSAPTSACRSPCGAPSTGTGASLASTPARRSRPPGTSSSGCCGSAFPMSIIASAGARTGRGARGRGRGDFADGTRETGDLLVAADGFRSSVRAAVLPEVQPLYAGYVAWRALVRGERLCARRAPRPLRILRLLPAPRRADARLSGRRARQRPSPGAPLRQPRRYRRRTRRRSCRGCDRRERGDPPRSRSPLPSSPRR